MNKHGYWSARGFTLLETMVVVAIIGILGAVGTVIYSDYIKRSRLVEAVFMFEQVRQNLLMDYTATLDFPDAILDAAPADNPGSDQLNASPNSMPLKNSDTFNEYWYYQNNEQGLGWFALQLDDQFIPNCAEQCQLHMGFREAAGGRLEFHCGLWNSADVADVFPLNVLPEGCNETCVSCQLRDAAGDAALQAALNNPRDGSQIAGNADPSLGDDFMPFQGGPFPAANNGGNNNGSGAPDSDDDADGESGNNDGDVAGTDGDNDAGGNPVADTGNDSIADNDSGNNFRDDDNDRRGRGGDNNEDRQNNRDRIGRNDNDDRRGRNGSDDDESEDEEAIADNDDRLDDNCEPAEGRSRGNAIARERANENSRLNRDDELCEDQEAEDDRGRRGNDRDRRNDRVRGRG